MATRRLPTQSPIGTPLNSLGYRPTALSSSLSLAEATPPPGPEAGLLIPEGGSLPPAGRLVVLVPESLEDVSGLARCIWRLAAPARLHVLFLALSGGASDAAGDCLLLARLAALTRDDRALVETRVESSRDWRRAVRAVFQPGDLVVCHAGQSVMGWAGARQPLEQALASRLGTPVVVLPRLEARAAARRPRRLAPILYWGVDFAVVGAFFWMQIRITQMASDWAHSALLYISVISEFGLLWMWNLLSG